MLENVRQAVRKERQEACGESVVHVLPASDWVVEIACGVEAFDSGHGVGANQRARRVHMVVGHAQSDGRTP